MSDFAIKGSARIIDTGLEQHIQAFAAYTGRSIRDVAKQALKSLVRYAIDFTPPSSGRTKGMAAKRAGEQAIITDLGKMGFTPVPIKGYRMLTHVYGRRLESPIRIKTQPNPKFADPEAHRRARLAAAGRRRGNISRGGRQAFYVDQRKYRPFRKRLLDQVGRLSSGWVQAARELGVPVPAFIARHAGLGRGTTVRTAVQGSRVTLSVINHFPAGTDSLAADVERRIAVFKTYVANSFARQLKAMYARGWKATKR